MEIPNHIDKALRLRTQYASALMDAMYEVDEWLDEHGIVCEDFDVRTGCEIYCNPYDSEQRIRENILNHIEGDN